MIPRIVCFILLVSVTCSGLCQEKEKDEKKKKGLQDVFVDVSGGVSVPTGVYTSLDRDNKKAGYTVTGYFIQANVDWMGKKDFGLAFQYCFQHNPFHSSAKNDTMYGTLYPLGDKGWSNHYVFVGPVYLKTMKWFSIDVRGMIGAILAFSQVFNNTDPVTRENVKNAAPGLAWQLGIGLGYNITPKIVVKASLGLMGATPKVDKSYGTHYPADTTAGTPSYINLTEVSIKKAVSSFNAGIGIIYKF